MYRLENNNIKQFNHNRTRQVERPLRYTNETSPVLQSVPQEINLIEAVGTQVAGALGQQLSELGQKKQQLTNINNENDFNNNYMFLTNEYKKEYEKNPNEELTKKYNEDVKTLLEEYKDKMSSNYKNEFLFKTNNIIKSNELNLKLFREDAEIKHQSELMINNLNNSLERLKESGFNQDISAIEDELWLLPQKEEQFKQVFGDVKGQQIIQDYKNKMLKTFIDGALNSENPEQAINIIDNANDNIFNNVIPKNEMYNYKKQAEQLQLKVDKWNNEKQRQQYNIEHNAILKQIHTGQLTNYNEIINALINTGADAMTSKFILREANYDTTLPPQLIQAIENREQEEKDRQYNLILNERIKKAEEREQRKLTEQEKKEELRRIKEEQKQQEKILKEQENYLKLKNKDEILTKITNYLLTIDKDKNADKNINDYDKIIKELYYNKILTSSEYETLQNKLDFTRTRILTTKTKEEFDNKAHWYSFKDTTYDLLEKDINNILEMNNIPTTEEYLKNDKQKKDFYKIKGQIQQNFLINMYNEFNKMKSLNPEYQNYNTWEDLKQVLPRNKVIETENKARINAISQFKNVSLNDYYTQEELKKMNDNEKISKLKNIIYENESQEIQVGLFDLLERNKR